MVKFLNEAGSSLKTLNREGRTPLLEAAKFRHAAVVEYLRTAAAERKDARDAERKRQRKAKAREAGEDFTDSDEEEGSVDEGRIRLPPIASAVS